MSELTELEQEADRKARHAHRELVKRLEARVAELERIALDWEEAAREESNRAEHAVDEQRTAWNDAIRAAAERADEYADEWGEPIDEDDFAQGAADEARAIAKNIRTLLRNEGGVNES